MVLSYHARMERVIDLPPQAFHPMPRVSSSLVRFTPRRDYSVVDYGLFRRIVEAGFHMRRKALINALARGLLISRSTMQRALVASNIDLYTRAEELEVEDFVRITRALAGSISSTGNTG